MSQFDHIDDEVLSTVGGGATTNGLLPQTPGAPRERPEEYGPRTWGQVGREYVAACVQGAAQATMFSGMPRNRRELATSAAMGCAMGVGMKAIDDVTGAITG